MSVSPEAQALLEAAMMDADRATVIHEMGRLVSRSPTLADAVSDLMDALQDAGRQLRLAHAGREYQEVVDLDPPPAEGDNVLLFPGGRR